MATTKIISAAKGWQAPLRKKDSVFMSVAEVKKAKGKPGKVKLHTSQRIPK